MGHRVGLQELGRATLLLALLPAGCGLGGPAYAPVAPEVAAVVEATNGLTFEPSSLSIDSGDTVEWRNVSLLTHTATADASRVEDATNVELPEGAEAFDSGDIPPGEVYRHRFTVPGTYRYVCVPHEGQRMRGSIMVRPRG